MPDSPAIKILFGLGLLGAAIYQLYAGKAFGRIRQFRREENPGYYWFIIACEIAVGLVWLDRALPQ
jgi:uncharacterized membrane protein YfcA